MYAIKQFYLKLFNAKTTMKDKTMMCDETKNECCNHADPPWEGPQVIPAQIRRVDNLIFRKINQFACANGMERKGYIERRSVPQDARLKQLVLTEEGICFHEKTMLCFHQTDDYVAGLLTAEENTELLRLLNKLRDALQ